MSYSSTFQQLTSLSSNTNVLLSAINTNLQNNYTSLHTADLNNLQESSETLRHVCRVCGKSFRASSLLDIHMRVHVGAKPFVCPVCNHRATQKGNLKLHMKKHHGQDLPPNIDIIPDSGIWGNIDKNIDPTSSSLLDSKKSQAHSSLLDQEVVELIKKCQNNIGQSGMGRISESLKDFIEMARSQNLPQVSQLDSKEWKWDNTNSNNNGFTPVPTSKEQLHSAAMQICKQFLENNIKTKPTQFTQMNNTVEKPIKPEGKLCYCQICGWETTSPGYLNVHMRKHKEETHVCSICGRAFKETWYLKNHMRSHINDLTHDQESLLPEFTYQIPIKDPIQSVPSTGHEMPYKSEPKPCQEDLSKESYVSLFSACNDCGHLFSNHTLSGHVLECGNPKTRANKPCTFCSNPNSDEKRIFMESLNLTSQDSYVTNIKKVAFVSEFNPLTSCLIKADDNISELKTERSLEPIQSEAKQALRQELLRSMVKKEDLRRSYTQQTVLTEERLQEYKSMPYKAPLASSLSEPSISMHKQIKQPYRNSAMQSLAEIGKTLLPKSELSYPENSFIKSENTIHKVVTGMEKQTFSSQQGFQCRFCLKWFKYRSVLGIHMRSHTGERPYKCSYCGYAGTQHNCLKLHIQRHHPKEYMAAHNNMVIQNKMHMQSASQAKKIISKRDEVLLNEQVAKFSPARCPICGRVSPSPGYLKIHMRSHKKTLDHICHVCGRGFKEYWYLSTHLRTHNREITGLQSMQVSNQPPVQSLMTAGFKEPTFEILASHEPKDKALPMYHKSSFINDHAQIKSSSWSFTGAKEEHVLSPVPPHHSNNAVSSLQHVPAREVAAIPHVSKRKAFQPSKFEPYPVKHPDREVSCKPVSTRRKSKPRKFTHGSYMTPVYKELTPIPMMELHSCQQGHEDEFYENVCSETQFKGCDEKPLDLSITTALVPCHSAAWESDCKQTADEPLNLVIK